jgi:hypothetical protein
LRSLTKIALAACILASRLTAQAPATGPVILLLPASTRAIGLGNAWVAGRDEDVLFYNPAQIIGARAGFDATVGEYGSRSKLGSMASVFTGGPLTLGWGVQFVNFSTPAGTPYPFVPATLTKTGATDAFALMATVGGAMTFKGFKIGIAAKYAEDRVAETAPGGIAMRHDAFLGDVGVAHNLWGGVAGLAVQNIGRGWVEGTTRIDTPTEGSLGWFRTQQLGELDIGLAGQVTARSGWVSPGGGVEVGYGWIEGYSAALRAGARRPEDWGEKPVGFGATFNADRLTLDYGLQLFDGGRVAHRVTFRWR